MKEFKVTYFKNCGAKSVKFEVTASTYEEANRLHDLLAFFDLYQEKVGITGEFVNSILIENLVDGEWVDYEELKENEAFDEGVEFEGLPTSDFWDEVSGLLK